jgi:hypothetical protein
MVCMVVAMVVEFAGLLLGHFVTEMFRGHMPRNTDLAYIVIFISSSRKKNIANPNSCKRLLLNFKYSVCTF